MIRVFMRLNKCRVHERVGHSLFFTRAFIVCFLSTKDLHGRPGRHKIRHSEKAKRKNKQTKMHRRNRDEFALYICYLKHYICSFIDVCCRNELQNIRTQRKRIFYDACNARIKFKNTTNLITHQVSHFFFSSYTRALLIYIRNLLLLSSANCVRCLWRKDNSAPRTKLICQTTSVCRLAVRECVRLYAPVCFGLFHFTEWKDIER